MNIEKITYNCGLGAIIYLFLQNIILNLNSKNKKMKKLLLFSILSVLFIAANAQVTSITELYGKYKFTSEMTVTAEGEEYSSNFAAESEVVISKDIIYDAALSGIAGGKGRPMGINKFDASAKRMGTTNPNSVSHWTVSNIGISTPDGKYPFGGNYDFYLTYDDEGNFTMDDFSLVLADHPTSTTVILAQFKNCKLTPIEIEKIEYEDMSGNWHFKSAQGEGTFDAESELPTEFDMVVSATSDDFKNYSVEIAYEGYTPVTVNATFNGEELVLALDNTCIDVENNIFLASYMFPSLQGNIRFKKGTTSTTMTLTSGMRLAQKNGESEIVTVQYYTSGIATKQVATDKVDFVGTYSVTAGDVMYNPSCSSTEEYPSAFDLEIVYDDEKECYLLTKFFGEKIDEQNNGGIVANVADDDPTMLKISVGNDAVLRTLSDGSVIVLYDKLGQSTGNVELKIDGDNVTISDFSVYYLAPGSDAALDALFMGNKITKGSGVVIESPIDYSQSYTVKFAADDVVVKNADVEFEFPTEFEIAFTDYGDYGVYMKSFLGEDISYLNSGGIMIENDEDDVRKFYLSLVGNKKIKSIVQGETYLILCDVNGKTEERLTVEIDNAGNVTISDFSICLFDSKSGQTEIAAVYSKNSSTTAVEGVAADRIVASVANNTIEIAGEPVAVEVYTLAGTLIYSGVTSEIANLDNGVYIVKIGNKVYRILL